ncbi:MAG: hypothetical protein GF398_03255 [Chitinivibrionales bacterium]|nr:hypothetical protein [Chitinivibrionales bacterium]
MKQTAPLSWHWLFTLLAVSRGELPRDATEPTPLQDGVTEIKSVYCGEYFINRLGGGLTMKKSRDRVTIRCANTTLEVRVLSNNNLKVKMSTANRHPALV